MDKRTTTYHPVPRAPLGDKGKRGNSVPPRTRSQAPKTYESDCKENVPIVVAEDEPVPGRPKKVSQPVSQPPADPRLSAVSQASREQEASKRDSQTSTASASTARSSDSKLKTHIGPWQLGKTLSKGSSARVRLARHRLTHQSVAVKIISKKSAYLSQAGSIAQLDKVEKDLPEEENGLRRLPVTVEREIAIMKLIEHPNIIKILDVWENRNEVYLILEYCESKDMFSWINRYGQLSEHDAVYVFRQMMCAMEYCHSFNICHRDLKPENILLSQAGEVKIIDFGMAALHQNDKKLRTSCGSPHYAAPELLKAKNYRGDKTDIWSMGVILFAMLAQRLPFDDPHLPTMLSLSKRALYTMPENFSPDAKDMIRRILVTEPDKRISIREMWDHPLIKKYDRIRGFEEHRKQPVDMRTRSKDAPINIRDIDPQILRQLRAMWHSVDEKEIKSKLLSKGFNEQKLFYHLLVSHRDRLLENYDPDLAHSTSDYHHLRPPAWTTRVSTRKFHVQGRTPSRFTVISTVADTEASGTVRSYDPYYASRNLAPGQASHARIVVHRAGSLEPGKARSVASGSVPSRMGTGSSSVARKRLNTSLRSRTVSYAPSQRSSMSSIRSSRQGTASVLVKPRHKRGVNFSSVRKGAPSADQQGNRRSIAASASIAGDQTTYNRDNTSPNSPRKKAKKEYDSTSLLHHIGTSASVVDDEMIHFSNSIARDCDDAFSSSLIASPSDTMDRNRQSLTPFSVDFGTPAIERTPEPICAPRAGIHPWDSRPLPPTPPTEVTPSSQRIQAPQKINTTSRHGPSVSLNVAPLATSAGQRRITSAPVYAQYARDARPLPSIFESPNVLNGQSRIVSAPPMKTPAALPTPNDNSNLDFLAANAEQTIRIVQSPTAMKETGSSIIPRPLNVRKKSASVPSDTVESHKASQESDARKKYSVHGWMPDLPEEPTTHGRSSSNGSSIGPRKKLSTWFRRNSRANSNGDMDETTDTSVTNEDQARETAAVATKPQRFDSTSTGAAPPPVAAQPSRKKSFMFWKTSKSNNRMSIAAPDYEDDSNSFDAAHHLSGAPSVTQDGYGDNADVVARKIEPQQNWLARLFRVKPAMRYLCLQISRRRARQEVTILLREWRKWGIRDVEVDKERNIVFARVGKKNFLNIKEVHFAVEIITVIEHGKRTHLSIVRFTQEKGAASSFHKVVDTMNSVFTSRGLLVQDSRKAKMMIKTLNS
ncbi:BR serine/threonine-protein kinase [Diaporthe amygdali]|uniref:BR serine/threonine-protein kinase n=1 Tax=Phomopsis amygdali TaxID=1214568 RepID=UPI0022FDF218|nr:BR serine/threonine-protein kinase [Diaporthe amygdali]KAJ0123371.1 BR serine/threonine-protein kinase [Diaporthe amygdali]